MFNSYSQFIEKLSSISAICPQSFNAIQEEWNTRTKPPGSLGRLENIAAWIGAVQQCTQPQIRFSALTLFAGAHGIVKEGVSMCPEHVNAQMMRNFAMGGAAINTLCRSNNIHFQAIDTGINTPTCNFLHEPAMSKAETLQALKLGWESVPDFADLFAVGEMGIGNTTPATAIISAITNKPINTITGRGAGLSDEKLAHKIKVLEQALINRKPELTSPLSILASIGGREIAAMTGAILSATSKNIPVVLDGVICSAAACIAFELHPAVIHKCIAGHKSAEPAHQAFLNHYELAPVLDLGMRLGEGTGAAVTMNIIRNAVDCFNEMATFEQAGVTL